MKSRKKKVSLICIQGSFSGIFFQMLKEHFSLHSSFKEAFEKCMEFLPKETQTILELLSRKKNNLQNVIFATFFISFLKKIRMKSFGDFNFWNAFSTFFQRHIVWKLLKMSHLYFWILAFSTNFCPIKTDLSGNTVWPQALEFQKLVKMNHFGHF